MHFRHVKTSIRAMEDTNFHSLPICDCRPGFVEYHIEALIAYMADAHERPCDLRNLEGGLHAVDWSRDRGRIEVENHQTKVLKPAAVANHEVLVSWNRLIPVVRTQVRRLGGKH